MVIRVDEVSEEVQLCTSSRVMYYMYMYLHERKNILGDETHAPRQLSQRRRGTREIPEFVNKSNAIIYILQVVRTAFTWNLPNNIYTVSICNVFDLACKKIIILNLH